MLKMIARTFQHRLSKSLRGRETEGGGGEGRWKSGGNREREASDQNFTSDERQIKSQKVFGSPPDSQTEGREFESQRAHNYFC